MTIAEGVNTIRGQFFIPDRPPCGGFAYTRAMHVLYPSAFVLSEAAVCPNPSR